MVIKRKQVSNHFDEHEKKFEFVPTLPGAFHFRCSTARVITTYSKETGLEQGEGCDIRPAKGRSYTFQCCGYLSTRHLVSVRANFGSNTSQNGRTTTKLFRQLRCTMSKQRNGSLDDGRQVLPKHALHRLAPFQWQTQTGSSHEKFLFAYSFATTSQR